MRNCDYRQNEEIIFSYLDNEMSEKDSFQFECHLSNCCFCKEFVQTWQKTQKVFTTNLIDTRSRDNQSKLTKSIMKIICDDSLKEEPLGNSLSYQKKKSSILTLFKPLAAAAIFIFALYLGWQETPKKTQIAKVAKPNNCEIDYFYSDSDHDVIFYDVDSDTKVVWLIDSETNTSEDA